MHLWKIMTWFIFYIKTKQYLDYELMKYAIVPEARQNWSLFIFEWVNEWLDNAI